MVLNGAMEQEELTLMPVFTGDRTNGLSTVYSTDSCTPAFILSDDDDIDDDDDFDDDDDYEDEELEEDEDEDEEEDDDYDEDDDWDDED